MSAIGGIVHPDGRPVDRAALDRMQALLAPYGRDAQQQWRQGPAGLLRTLLRVTPEDAFDRQPLAGPQGDVVVFDGCLDNRAELAAALGVAGTDLARLSDADLALRACLRWDTAAVDHLLGDFAIACWSPSRRRLWLARDAIGHRPLFWHRQDGLFAFASMPKALFAIPNVPRELCEERMADHLAMLPMVGPESMYRGIHRVEPGQQLVFQDDRVTTRHHYRLDPARELRLGSDSAYEEALAEHLERAVARCLRCAGPVASHLSAGFDSGVVTALAARQLAGREERLLAYTAVPREGYDLPVMPGRYADEWPGAHALATRFDNIDHLAIRSGDNALVDGLEKDTEAVDRPLVNLCNRTWDRAIRNDAQSRGVRLLLCAQGGNMTISHTGMDRLSTLFGHGHWRTWLDELLAVKRHHPHRRMRGLLAESIGPWLPQPLWRVLGRLQGRSAALAEYSAIHPEFARRMDVQERARAAGWDLSYRPSRDSRRLRVAVLGRRDPGEQMAMANLSGLQMRDPTRDRQLTEFCLALPAEQYLRHGQTRWLLRRVTGDLLPPSIWSTPGKGLQAADWHVSATASLPALRAMLAELEQHPTVGKIIDLQAMKHSLDQWPEEGWERRDVVLRFRGQLLRGLATGQFIRYVEPDNR